MLNILRQIERWADQTPDQVCYVWRQERLTYGELKQKSDALSYWIDEVFGSDRAPILIHGHMHPNMIVLFLACIKSGHAYIPVDLSVPADRISMILEDSATQLVFSERPMLFPECTQKVVGFDQLNNMIAKYPNQRVSDDRAVNGEDVLYIIYTSGSTGRPKGVQIPHESLESFVSWMNQDFGLENRQTFMNQAPYSFDLSVMSLYPSLTMGGTLWAIDKDMIAQPAELVESLKKSDINIWVSTPSFAEICLMLPSFSQEILPDLHMFLFCGETLPVQVAENLQNHFPNAAIVNTYGPTESTVAVTSIQIKKDMLVNHLALPVGHCKSDCRILILDSDGHSVPEGEKGEIVICGPSVGKGYLNDPEKTNAAFGKVDGQRSYHTKDLGSLRNGLLYYHGRMDRQIKIHGFRMELEEIEHVLSSCSYVKQAAVLPIKKGETYDHLLGVVVAGTHSFEKSYHLSSAIRKEMSRYLPSYMLPRKFVYHASLPMTTNGKVDRKALLKEAVR